MTDWFMKNLACIRGRDALLYRNLAEHGQPGSEADWSIVDLMMRPREWLFGLGSFSASATVVMYGFGDGEHVMYVLERLGEKGHLIAVVPDVPEFLELMHTADMEALLGDPRLHLVVFGMNNDMLLRYMSACFTPATIGLAKILVLPDYEDLYPDGLTFLDQALEVVIQWLDGR